MATTTDLQTLEFTSSEVAARRLNIQHPDPAGRGPFCRLAVTTTAPLAPGVYAWVVDGDVRYVGMASVLLHVVNGARMGRAYNDYTYMPPSKVQQLSSPRVGVNGRLNAALVAGSTVEWWWLALPTVAEAERYEDELIRKWRPSLWNRRVRPA